MHPSLTFRVSVFWLAVIASVSMLMSTAVGQGTGGRILGRVSDPTGAVLGNVKVKLTNDATGVSRETTTSEAGDYSLVEVPVGAYSLSFDLTGFKTNVRHDVVVQVNAVVTLNMVMQIGTAAEVVDVTSEAPLVETTSTQLGAVVDDRSVSQLPLNARDTYQFLQLQPGVMSTVGSSSTITYGSDKSGAVSVNGGRGRSNNFSVNGGDANDQFVNLPTVQPSPDSIQEFRVLTNTFDAEYGRNSGSVVNVVTKSGTNQFHGNVYEFFRNTVLNSRNYFDTTTPQFNQNQFGATFGGPILKDRTFFFASYEGRRIRQGITSLFVTLPTAAEMPSATQPFANFTDAGGFSPGDVLSNSNILTKRPGCQAQVTANGGAAITDGVAYTDIFPNGKIPLACMDATSVDLLQYLPSSNVTVPVQPSRGDQGTLRIDHRINSKQNFSGYYYITDDHTVQPFSNFQLEGATVPGFGSIINERFQQWNLSHTWTVTNNSVNEFHFNYNREAQRTFQHPQFTSAVQSSCPPAPSWLTSVTGPVPCFSDGTAANGLGIHPGLPSDRTGLPFIDISGGFFLGNNAEGELPQVGNSFQWSDNFTRVAGNHTMKFGGDVRRQRFDQTLYFNVSGDYFYFGGGPNDAETNNGNLYPNFLLGLPDQYGQGSAQTENVRSTSLYLFAQDSWKIRPNITLNYGLRWEFNTPIADIGGRVQTFRPGKLSSVYPCLNTVGTTGNTDCSSQTPVGLLVPGDTGIPPGLTQTYYKAIAPRIGIAWSPGNSGKTSIRAGWGLFYNPIEQLVLEQFSAEPPFGGSIILGNTQFNTPFLGQDGATTYPNVFNGIITPKPGTPIDWGLYEPILLYGEFEPHMRAQYSAQYNLTVQRELTHDMKLQLGYVGSQGHRLLATHDINYGNAQTCIDLNSILGDGTCGQFYADTSFFIPGGTVLPVALHLPYAQNHSVIPKGTTVGPNGITLVGLRPYSAPQCDPMTGSGCPTSGIPVFSSIFAQDTIANSAYNSLQASLEKRFAHGLQFTAAYTYSKSIDQASSFEGILNPIDPRNSRGLSIFDARHRFVFSYYWELPVQKFDGAKGKILDGWALSGITTFQTGFPIRITSSADNELMDSFDFELPGQPDQIGPFQTLHPQNHGNYYFNPGSFTEDTTIDPSLFGRIGNAPRTICCGPHISNTDFAVLKNISVTEGTHFEFRAELFNLFNHTQFFNPDGNSSDGTQFGQVTQARDPREMQFALKFYF
ncbi:MAG: carboxypeptidase regulatory-like domain-containing protein [Terriglobales bacterium]